MILSAEQCRAGRGQVGLSQKALSKAAGITLKTLSDFENGKTHPYARTLEAIRTALEAAGVAFIEPSGDESGVRGVGGQVSVGSAATWITGTELKQWADRGFIAKRSDVLGNAWVQDALAYLHQDAGNDAKILGFCLGLRCQRPAWNVVEQLGAEVEQGYWAQVYPHLANEPEEDVTYAVERLVAVGRPKAAFGVVSYQPSRISPLLLAQILESLATMPTEEEGRLEPYSICEAFEALDAAPSVPEETLAGLEWIYLSVLASYGNRRGPRILHQKLAEDPTFYVNVLKFIYRHEDKDQAQREAENESLPTENIEQRADRAYELMHGWHRVPGKGPDNTVDEQELWGWVQRSRSLAAEAGRISACDRHIGKVFAHAPADPDGTWPAEAVRNVIERVKSRDLEHSFEIGVLNRRGVYSKSPNEGGRQELELAERYGRLSEVLTEKSPRVASILQSLAESYLAAARDEDIRAERRDLEY